MHIFEVPNVRVYYLNSAEWQQPNVGIFTDFYCRWNESVDKVLYQFIYSS